MTDPVFFVWIEGMRSEPVPQIWYGDKTRDMKPIKTLAKHRLTDKQIGLDIDVLAMIYPAPKEETP